jgi:putative ABC transport system substrate-binding protein
MKKHLISLLVGLLSLSLFSFGASAAPMQAASITVGILQPVAIQAITEITNGFEQKLTSLYPGHIHFIVENSQGDVNIQRSILQQFKARNVDMVVPIGSNAAQMAASINRKQPIVALAAEFQTKQRDQFRNKNITNVIDQIDISKQLKFIHTAFPKMKKITIMYSPTDTIFPEVKKANAAGKKYGIQIQKLMIQGLPDLYTVSQHIDNDSNAIFVLKDLLVVSGINTLIKQAAQKHILLIASDDGSVQKGADLAVGVSESLIGAKGAELAAKILSGTPASQIPVARIKLYHVYVTPSYETSKAYGKDFSFANVKKAAKKFGYPVNTLPLVTS